MTYDKISHLHGKSFRRIVGVKESVFALMVLTVKSVKASTRKHPTRGQQSALSVEDQVLMTCLFWREYRDQEHIALDFGIHQSTVSRIIRNIEQILIQSGEFSLPGKKALKSGGLEYEIVVVDVTETPTQRPKKKQKRKYSGKKKRHTLKTIIIIDAKTKEIICIATANGKTHDFKMFKNMGLDINIKTKVLGDLGFLGIDKIHSNSEIPHKNTKKIQ